MLLAKKQDTHSFELYISLIDNVTDHEDVVLNVFSKIIRQSKRLADQEISYYQVDRGIYPIVSFLVSKNKDLIQSLNADDLEKKDLISLKKLLENNLIEFA